MTAMCKRYWTLQDEVERAAQAATAKQVPTDADETFQEAIAAEQAHLAVCDNCREYLDRISGHQSKPVDLVSED